MKNVFTFTANWTTFISRDFSSLQTLINFFDQIDGQGRIDKEMGMVKWFLKSFQLHFDGSMFSFDVSDAKPPPRINVKSCRIKSSLLHPWQQLNARGKKNEKNRVHQSNCSFLEFEWNLPTFTVQHQTFQFI